MTERSTRGARWRWGLLIAGGIVLALGGRSLASHLTTLTSHLHALGVWGPVLFVAGFAVASVAFVPAGLLTLTAGALFGLPAGIAYAFLGASTGACLAFLLARYAAREMVERWLPGYPRIALLRGVVGDNGRRIVTLLRLSPVIPFSVINLAMGVTTIRFVDFTVANLGMLPVTALYVYYGAAAGAIVTAHGTPHHRGAAYYLVLVLGLGATVAVTTIVARLATRELAREVGVPE